MQVDNNRLKAIVGTILFHALLLIAFMFLALRTPLPLPGEQGVEVNLGYADRGKGAVATQKPQPKQVQPKKKRIEKIEKHLSPSISKPVSDKAKELTQNTEKAPLLEKKKKEPAKHKPKKVVRKKVNTVPVVKKIEPKPKAVEKKPVNKEVVRKKKEVVPPKPVLNKRALFKVPVSQNTQGQGITKGLGDHGKLKGSKISNSYSGKGGEGRGISYSLGDRGARFLDKPSSGFTEQGTVVVKIWVNPRGNVIKAQISAKGTTVVDESLRRMAVRAARNSSFSNDPAAPAQQIGTITYNFILKK